MAKERARQEICFDERNGVGGEMSESDERKNDKYYRWKTTENEQKISSMSLKNINLKKKEHKYRKKKKILRYLKKSR